MSDLREHAVAPARLHRERGRCRDSGRKADQDLRRIGIRHIAAQMRAQEHPVSSAHMAHIPAHLNDAADRVCAGHERHRRKAVRHLTRQHASHVGQHHAGLDPNQYAVRRRCGRFDIIEPQIIMCV